MDLATKLNAQGYVGRILLLKAELAKRDQSTLLGLHLETVEEIELKIKAVRSNLEGLVAGSDVPPSTEALFTYFIPWQVR